MTPPPIIGLANGVAQSIVSLARGFGPLLGGYVSAPSLSIYIFSDIALQMWSVSVQGNPSGYYTGFVVVGAACALAVLHSFSIR